MQSYTILVFEFVPVPFSNSSYSYSSASKGYNRQKHPKQTRRKYERNFQRKKEKEPIIFNGKIVLKRLCKQAAIHPSSKSLWFRVNRQTRQVSSVNLKENRQRNKRQLSMEKNERRGERDIIIKTDDFNSNEEVPHLMWENDEREMILIWCWDTTQSNNLFVR